jgi:NAD/NADP transhydrogenase beta subunit
MKDEWYENSIIFFAIVVIGMFYYLFKDDMETNRFFRLGYNDDLVFLHKRINTLRKYIEILVACFVIGAITSYWDNVIYHIHSKRFHLKTKKMSLNTFIILSKFLSRIFSMIMIYLTITSNVQFIFMYLLGNVAFQIPYTKSYGAK